MTVNGAGTRSQQLRYWWESPRERLRHTVTEANLLRHLDAAPQRVLDVAGGDGTDAIRLAALGHEVTMLDPAGAMLTTAMENAEAYDVADRLHVVQAVAEDAPELFSANDFDAVLCHNLLQFVDDRRAMLAAVMAPLRRGGLLSVLAPNADSVAEPAGPSCAPEEIVEHLVALGVTMVRRYGVRCLPDPRPDEEIDDTGLAALELAMADRMPYLATARYLHLIALY
jgi:2-polyprenyl-3-methyl-5-hydroxy-6-metoxy-1,4-benzoquinol methylase